MKKLIAGFAMLAMITTASAQKTVKSEKMRTRTQTVETYDQYRVVTNKFWNNCFIDFGIGGGFYQGDHNRDHDIAPSLKNVLFGSYNLSIGKWFTPGIGLRIGFDIDKVRVYVNSHDKDNIPHWQHYYNDIYSTTKFTAGNFHGDALFDMCDLLGGYKENRFYRFIAFGGFGYIKAFDKPRTNKVTVSVGFINQFRVSDRWRANIELRAKAFSDDFNGYGEGHDNDGILTMSVGMTYRLGQQSWVRYNPRLVRTEKEYDMLSEKVAGLRAENEALRNAPVPVAEKITKVVYKLSPLIITFKIDTWDLTDDARVNLGFLAEAIKAMGGSTRYLITGYADKGTGSVERNIKLSKERARVIYECLVNEFGVPAEQLTTDYKGGVDNMYYNNPKVSRATIVRAE